MSQNYTPEFKKKIVRLHEEEGRTYKSITAEYGVSKASISKWCSEFSKECQADPKAKEDYGSMKENLRLKRENEELRKEIAFLKKSGGILCKGNRLEAYRFIDSHQEEFGVRWLLRRLGICRIPTITTGSTGRQIIMPKKQWFRSKSAASTTAIMEWTAIAA